MEQQEPPERFVREAECGRISGVSRPTRWRWESEGRFPKRVRLGPNSVAWRLSGLLAWVESKANERRGKTGQ